MFQFPSFALGLSVNFGRDGMKVYHECPSERRLSSGVLLTTPMGQREQGVSSHRMLVRDEKEQMAEKRSPYQYDRPCPPGGNVL